MPESPAVNGLSGIVRTGNMIFATRENDLCSIRRVLNGCAEYTVQVIIENKFGKESDEKIETSK